MFLLFWGFHPFNSCRTENLLLLQLISSKSHQLFTVFHLSSVLILYCLSVPTTETFCGIIKRAAWEHECTHKVLLIYLKLHPDLPRENSTVCYLFFFWHARSSELPKINTVTVLKSNIPSTAFCGFVCIPSPFCHQTSPSFSQP